MKLNTIFRSITFFILFFASLLFLRPFFVDASKPDIKDKYIVVFNDEIKNPKDSIASLEKLHGFKAKHIYAHALKGFSAELSPERVEKIKKDSKVAYIVDDRIVSIEAKGGIPGGKPKPTATPRPTATPTKIPTPTSTPTTAPTATPTVTPTPISGIGLNTYQDSVNTVIMAGTQQRVLDLTSVGATDFTFYGYPTSFGPGINWVPSSGGIAVGSTIPINVQVNHGIASGVYTGTTMLKSSLSNDYMTVTISITVVDNPNGPLIKVLTPNGPETLYVGETFRITWDSTNINTVNIGYKSCDSCLDWIATGISNVGYYDWVVNVGNTTNTQFKIDLTGYMTGTGSSHDLSDASFTVFQPTPTVTPTSIPTPTPTPKPFSETPTGVARIGSNSANFGDGIAVAVMDTGIDLTHPELSSKIIASVNCLNPDNSSNDDHGHGTHVAGSIAALKNGLGVVGVAPNASLVSIKVLDLNGYGTWASIICGIDYVTANAQTLGIKVANMSLGGGGTSDNNCGYSNNDPVHTAICNSTQAGVAYVVAAMNNSQDASYGIPAAYDDTVITVSALQDYDGKPGGLAGSSDDIFASFSNYGTAVDIAGPGVNIYSTYKNGGYTYMSGTSMATPHVAGAAALYIKSHAGSTWSQVRDGLRSVAEPLNQGHTDPSGLHPEPVVKVSSL